MFLNRGPGKSELFWPNLDESNSILPSDIDRPATLSLLGTDISNPPNQPTKLRKMMDRLRIVNAPTAFVLLRDCVQATSTHLLRTTPPNQLQSWCAAADHVITGGLEFIADSALPASKAPLHSIGIRLPCQTAPAAYFGSRMQFQEITDRLAGMRIPIELPYSLQTVDIPRKHVQRALSTAIMNQEVDAWNSSAPGPVVKFLSTIDAPSDWLRHLFRFKISPSHFQIILQLRLGVPLFDPGQTCSSHRGQNTPIDEYGYHFLGCVTRERTQRHNAVRDCIFEEAQAGAYSPVLEQRLDLLGVQVRRPSEPSRAPAEVRPADIWLPSSRICLDVCVVKPQQNETLPPAHDGFEGKLKKYAEVLDDSVRFIPLAFEHGGRVHPDSKAFLETLAARSAPRKGMSVSSNTKWFLRRIHFTIDKFNAAILFAKLQFAPRHHRLPQDQEERNDTTPTHLHYSPS